MRIDQLLKSSPITGPTARLDAELLLAHLLGQTRTWLFTWADKQLTPQQLGEFEQLAARRNQGEPVAQIIGTQAFWDVDLMVTPDVLIARPETEQLVEWVLELATPEAAIAELSIADLGTGSGAIAIALARELPHASITGFDLSDKALAVASQNTAQWAPRVKLHQGSWLSNYQGSPFDLIVSNPPYIDQNDQQVAANVRQYEPAMALFAKDHGLADIKTIIAQSTSHLAKGGWLLFEHGLTQGPQVRALLTAAGFTQVVTRQDLAGLDRLTGGCFE